MSGNRWNRGNAFRTVALAAFLGAVMVLPSVQASPSPKRGHLSKHVLLISVDGLHGIDLEKWVDSHPGSALAELAEHGYQYNNASCPKPSDSFPGLQALIAGGTPNSTGVWYDASYDRSYIAPGLPPGSPLGSPLGYTEALDKEPGTILTTDTSIVPGLFPSNPADGNLPVTPWKFTRVNNIFEVAKSHGLRTAWSDKHTCAYQIVRGPSGGGVDDYFSPEITNTVIPPGVDFTQSHIQIKVYDDIKVDALEKEAMGFDHSGLHHVGAPNIFGMNFQSVSVGQKLKVDPVDPTLLGGYLDGDATPGTALAAALKYVDGAIGDIVKSLKAGGIYHDTTIVISSKHGQSPIDPKKRIAADDSFYAVALNTVAPNLGDKATITTDTIALIWLDPKQQGFTEQAVAAIRADPNLTTSAGGLPLIDEILWGESLKRLYNDPKKDPRVPDIIVLPTPGVIYTGGSKRAEHGGFSKEDTSVALLVSHPSLAHRTFKTPVQTMQVAPTILKILGLDPDELKAVREEHTDALPGFDGKE
jgi:predicted AlkP superfamily pyrophosphatase or phosphodiesterase